MKKNWPMVLIGVCLAVMLAGCSAFAGQNIGELLRAPALGEGQDEIQRALAAYLEDEPRYKYPKEGGWLSPLRRADLDGDGRDEAIVLYTAGEGTPAGAERGNTVCVAILERQDGAWTVVQDIRGKYTDVASLDVTDLLRDGTRQLVIGYSAANLTNKWLTLYTYQGQTLSAVYEYEYSRYEIGDYSGRGGSDLVLVSGGDQQLQLQYIPTLDGKFVASGLEPVLLSANLTSCVGLRAGAGPDGSRVIVVDGTVVNGGLASQFVYYSAERDRFYATNETDEMISATFRLSAALKSRDVDGDGVVEIPLRVERSGAFLLEEKRLEYIEWIEYTPEEDIAKQYGLFDSRRGVYIRFPDEWRGNTAIVNGEDPDGWVVQNTRTLDVLLEMRVYEGGGVPVDAVQVPGSLSSYLVFGRSLPQAQRGIVAMLAMA